MVNSYKVVYKFNNVEGYQVMRATSMEGAKDLFNDGIKRFLRDAYKYIRVLDIIEL